LRAVGLVLWTKSGTLARAGQWNSDRGRRLSKTLVAVLDAHVAAAFAKQTERGARISHAGGRHTSNRIDAVIALAMALAAFEEQPAPTKLIGWL
jgi:hypothetical protein